MCSWWAISTFIHSFIHSLLKHVEVLKASCTFNRTARIRVLERISLGTSHVWMIPRLLTDKKRPLDKQLFKQILFPASCLHCYHINHTLVAIMNTIILVRSTTILLLLSIIKVQFVKALHVYSNLALCRQYSESAFFYV